MKSIAKYQVIEELGVSPTGKSYRVRDAFRSREFALKVLQTAPGVSIEAKQQFCEQLGSCAELNHRHIAKIQDLGEVEEGIFVATDWYLGQDFRRFMEGSHDVPLGQKLAVVAQVAEGLAFAHSRGIAHGNLKPSNIFIDAARDVHILDFGVAKWLVALLNAGCRPEGLLANYLAPEQVLGQPFDVRSDIFALGLILYEFVTGRYPFAADPGLVPREIVHSEPEPLSKLDAQVPQELEQLVTRALKKNPEQRLPSSEEFASGLYLAAQQLRRVASPAPAAAPPSAAPTVTETSSYQLPPALTPEPVITQSAAQPVPPQPAPQPVSQPAPAQPAPVTTLESPNLQFAVPAAPPARERPQDIAPEPRPWTARSYAASTPIPPVAGADSPKPPVIPPPVYCAPDPPTPEFQPPKSFLQPTAFVSEPPQATAKKKASPAAKRMLIAAVGLILAVGIVNLLVSRQNLKASQNRSHPTIAVTEPIAPAAKPLPPPTPRVVEPNSPKPGESGPDDLGNPEFSARQTLNGPVRSMWESGRYSQALVLVNQVLANDPTNEDARSWKKKIREAQAAEAALK